MGPGFAGEQPLIFTGRRGTTLASTLNDIYFAVILLGYVLMSASTSLDGPVGGRDGDFTGARDPRGLYRDFGLATRGETGGCEGCNVRPRSVTSTVAAG